MISFIVTHRARELMLIDYVESLHKFYPDCEVVIAEQGDDLNFLQGQLFNLAFPHSHGSIVVLMDVDIRFKYRIDFENEMQKLNRPFIGYDRILNCTDEGKLLTLRPGSDRTHGGCCVFTRRQFEASCGYSNLMCDWGAEDDIIDMRVGGFGRISNVVLHIDHPKRKNPSTYSGNRAMYETEKDRDKQKDGFKQTTGKIVRRQEGFRNIHLVFSDIGVVEDFAYASLLRDFHVNTLQNNSSDV